MTTRIPILLMAFCMPVSIAWTQSQLSSSLVDFCDDPAFSHAGISITVMDLKTGETIAAHQPELALIPASALKVLTTATALAVLGPEYQFKTELLYTGHVDEQGTLQGDVIVRGQGDPTLGSDQMPGAESLERTLEKFRMALQRAGIRKISGRIIADASYFDTAVNSPSWAWNDLGNYYAGGAWGLNIHENLYYLRFRQKQELESTPQITEVSPPIAGLEFRNELKSAPRGTGDNAYIFGSPYTFLRYVRGTIPIGNGLFTIKGSIPNPPLFVAQAFRLTLEEIGIICSEGSTTLQDLQRAKSEGLAPETDARLLYRHLSPKLREIVNRANQRSVNLYCESLLKVLGQEALGAGSVEAGLEVIRSYWEERGLKFSGCSLEDGSGLSPRNAVTSLFLTRLLRLVATDSAIYQDFRNSLPVAGVSGTLKSYLVKSPAQGKVLAKTGSMDRVRALTGYAETAQGKQRVFTIILNNQIEKNSNIRKKLERLLLQIYRS